VTTAQSTQPRPPIAQQPGAWTATLQYEELPLWDTMQSHANILIGLMKDQWLGLQAGDVKRDEALECVTLDFELPHEHQVTTGQLQEFIEREWHDLAGPGSSVTVEARQNV